MPKDLFSLSDFRRAQALLATILTEPLEVQELIRQLLANPTPITRAVSMRITTSNRIQHNRYLIARAGLRLTQRELAAKAHVSASAINSIEHDQGIPADQLARIENVLGISHNDIGMGSDPDPTPTKPTKRRKKIGRPRIHFDNVKSRFYPASPTLIKKLREGRRALMLSAEDLSTKIGYGKGYILSIELGKRRPSYQALIEISKALGIPVSDFGDISTLVIRPKGGVRGKHAAGGSGQG